jgi:cell division protein FtsB
MKSHALSASSVWVLVFALWSLFLSGAMASFVGSPGVLQLVRLKSLLATKHATLAQIQDDLKRLQSDAVLLEKSRPLQQREIRRVLGYAAEGELIFDFSDKYSQ